MRLVTAEDVKRLVHGENSVAVLDVREHGQYGEGHLLFASNCPYSALEIKAPNLVPDQGVELVICDDGDGVAMRAAEQLEALGYRLVSVLDGGAPAWQAAGYALFKGVNVPSKVLGELVEHACQTPTITADELERIRNRGEDTVLIDGRPASDFAKMTIPGARSIPNGEFLYRFNALAIGEKTPIVIHCAGRTRGLIGAQSLINAGVKNPVYALENGTQGWVLSGRDLLRGAEGEALPEPSDTQKNADKDMALSLARAHQVPVLPAQDLEAWKGKGAVAPYLLDVRSHAEFDERRVPASRHAPAVQLVQATDEWVAMRRARIALLDDNCVRSVSVAIWLRQMGHDAVVLDDAMQLAVTPKRLEQPSQIDVPFTPLPLISVSELMPNSDETLIIDVRASDAYREAHLPNSIWAIRPRMGTLVPRVENQVVFVSDCPRIAALAAAELQIHCDADMFLLDGGVEAWRSAGQELETYGRAPSKAESIDFLYFVHDRHSGNLEASRRYLAWETGLVNMLDAEDRQMFSVGGRGR